MKRKARLLKKALALVICCDSAERAKRSAKLGQMLVDDNTDAADSIAFLLGAPGHDVRVAYSANSALHGTLQKLLQKNELNSE